MILLGTIRYNSRGVAIDSEEKTTNKTRTFHTFSYQTTKNCLITYETMEFIGKDRSQTYTVQSTQCVVKYVQSLEIERESFRKKNYLTILFWHILQTGSFVWWTWQVSWGACYTYTKRWITHHNAHGPITHQSYFKLDSPDDTWWYMNGDINIYKTYTRMRRDTVGSFHIRQVLRLVPFALAADPYRISYPHHGIANEDNDTLDECYIDSDSAHVRVSSKPYNLPIYPRWC